MLDAHARGETTAWHHDGQQTIHEGACPLLADGVDIRAIQLTPGHASSQQTQRYLNITDEELREGHDRHVGTPAVPSGQSVEADRHRWECPSVNSRLHRLSVDCESAPRKVARPAGLEPATPGLEGEIRVM